MPVQWNLKQWLAVKHQIYRPSELQPLLEEKAGLQLSLQAISSLLNNVPNALRLSTIQALCNALDCTLSDFCEVVPDLSEYRSQNTVSLPDVGTDKPYQQNMDALLEEKDRAVKPGVDTAIREIVLSILEEQGLIPRKPEVVLQRSSISVLVPHWIWSISPDLTRGIAEAITRSSYDIALYSVNDDNPQRDENALIERFLATPFSAGLVAVFSHLSSQLTQLAQKGFPVVAIDDQEAQMVPWVGVDNTTGAYMAVQHLLRLGHRRIAHIKGPAEYLVSSARYQGYSQALREAGLYPDPELVLEGDFLPPSGRACANAFFALPPTKRPTAIFAASDQMAYGVLAAAEEAGLSVPRDIALVGFDDDHPSAYTHPPLTTVRQPYFEMGEQSVALLLSLLEAGDISARMGVSSTENVPSSQKEGSLPSLENPVPHIQLQASLIVRASCGADYHSTINGSPEPKRY